MTAKTNRLSMEAPLVPAMYSPAAVLPWVAPRIAVKLSPSATHASVQSAAVLAWTSRWPRPNTGRSIAVSTGTAAMRAIHAQSGGFTRAGPSGRWGYGRRRSLRGLAGPTPPGRAAVVTMTSFGITRTISRSWQVARSGAAPAPGPRASRCRRTRGRPPPRRGRPEGNALLEVEADALRIVVQVPDRQVLPHDQLEVVAAG